jgi:hypothetical protein
MEHYWKNKKYSQRSAFLKKKLLISLQFHTESPISIFTTFKGKGSGKDESRDFTDAEASGGNAALDRRWPFFFEPLDRSQGANHDRRLAVLCLIELFDGPLEAYFEQIVAQDGAGRIEQVLDQRVLEQLLAHADVLHPLPWKYYNRSVLWIH